MLHLPPLTGRSAARKAGEGMAGEKRREGEGREGREKAEKGGTEGVLYLEPWQQDAAGLWDHGTMGL
jgi:hypothetical protein